MLKSVLLLSFVATCLGNALRGQTLQDRRIIGGSTADIADYPYQVAIEGGSSGGHICGGALINETWVLTAAHCVLGNSDSYFVRAGTSTLERGGSSHFVSKVITHPEYNGRTYDYDYALVEVSIPFTLSSDIGIIDLPSQGEEIKEGTTCVMTGWGSLIEDGPFSIHLQQVSIPIASRSQCDKAYGGITARMICAGFATGGKDACQGDAGGPLVANGTLYGVASFGNGCARPDYPGVYSQVATIRDWITASIGI